MATDYYDIMRVGVEQFAYLKCPSKIRAAVINAGGPRLTVDVIQRRLKRLGTKPERAVGEPRDCDAEEFRVAGLVQQPVVRAITAEERWKIAKLAQGIGDKPRPPRARTFRYRGPAPVYGRTGYADEVIERVCEGMELPREVFFSLSRQKYIVAARSLVVKLLRDRNAAIYSYPRIAQIVGRNDHSTMIHAYQQFDYYCTLFPVLPALYAELRECGE